jgi:murein DD-endopeptidase MepM/ murein hydrolase activator NlpD
MASATAIPKPTLSPTIHASSTATNLPPTATPAPTPKPTLVAATNPTPVAQPNTAFQYAFPVQSDTIAYGRAHHDYPATDIFCPVGSIFVAPTNGVIDYVNREDLWNPKTDQPADRGGLSIALIGDDGVRYYGSHLSQINEEITPGLRVEVGQQLGLTGKSGNARFTPSHLHFGISHPTTPDDWRIRRGEISPYPYLKSWEQGQPVTPPLP